MNELHKSWQGMKVKKDNEEKKGLQEQIACSEKLRTLQTNPGWKILEDYLDKKLDVSMNLLLNADTERKIFYLQAVIATIKEIFEKIGVSHKEARTAEEIMKKYI